MSKNDTNTHTYYVVKPTTHQRKKVTYGDALDLTESQARPLRNGGFITTDQAAANRIKELMDILNDKGIVEAEETPDKTDDNKGETK